ncbi:cation:proton antiporter [uncultured Amnibacterium sp.]|uniref:cation:proton antiporter n=1 Tax=uncultured Amnibacterium sp. TaxID=1631851 RepID=UPI0035CC7B20
MSPTEQGVVLVAAALLVVAGAAAFSPRLRIPAPLVLVVVGIGLSLLPVVPTVVVDPQLVLIGILPPLLYAGSVSMPSMDLRREFGTISGLSVLLVVISALVLGWLFTVLIPGLGYAWGVALGAVISPTDAVATSIVKKADVSHRVIAILEGESLLNDASALVVLRAAVAAGAAASAGVDIPFVVGQFGYSVVVAVVIGIVVGRGSVWLRSKVTDSTVNTVISFTVPFIAAIPTELAGGSGLVAAVAAGLAVGRQAPRRLSAEHRRSDTENWAMVSLLLEGAIFLLMGLEIAQIVSTGVSPRTVGALPIAVAALATVVLLRAAFVIPLLLLLRGSGRRRTRFRERLTDMQQAISEGGQPALEARRQERRTEPQRGRQRRRPLRPITTQDFERFSKRVRQALADIDYLAASPLGPREGAVVVWAGMRGAVTVAAVQTLEPGTPHRDLLVLVAFGVAAISLIVQGGTLSALIRLLKPQGDDPEARKAEQVKVLQLIRDSTGTLSGPEGDAQLRAMSIDERLARIRTSRNALLDARDEGVFSADVLSSALESLDAMELAIDVRKGSA